MTRSLCKMTRPSTQQIKLVFRTFNLMHAIGKYELRNTHMLYTLGYLKYIYLHHHQHNTASEPYDLLRGIGKQTPIKKEKKTSYHKKTITIQSNIKI